MIVDLLPCSQSPTVLPHVAYVELIPYPYFPLSKICFICLSFPLRAGLPSSFPVRVSYLNVVRAPYK